MKRLLSVLLSAVLLFCLLPIAAVGEPVVVYQSDFTNSADDWYARGSAAVSLLPEGALHVQDRTADWHSAGRDFDLMEGVCYAFSVSVRQSETEQAKLMVSVAHAANGAETYENLAVASVPRGAWTVLQGTYTAGAYDRFVLYVETVNAPTLAFDLKDFILSAPEGTVIVSSPAPAAPAATNTPDGALPSLWQTYAGSFDFGTAIPRSVTMDPKVMAFVKAQFNIITPENELKPDSVLDVAASKKLAVEDETAVAVRFDAVRQILNFAQRNGIKVHGHVLVWHSQTPETFFHQGYDSKKPLVSREVMLGRLENYIRLVMEYTGENYPGVIVSWDVVNEAIDDSTGKLRASNWTRVVGEDFIDYAFAFARKYAPEGVLLYYNDYNSAMAGKLNGIMGILRRLIQNGTIDGYGFQMHHDANYPTIEMIRTAVERVAALGIKIRVSELDIGIPSATDANLQRQALLYGRIMKLLLRFSDQVEAVQVWGISDNRSWRAQKFPLLFDKNLQPKPAFFAVIDPSTVN